MLWNLLHFCLLQFCLCKSELVQIEVLPPFWAWLQLRDLLCSWGFHVKWTKIKNVKHSHPSTTGFAASSPGSPRSPGRWNRNLLKETLLKTIFLFYLNICVMKLTAALEVTHFYHWLWVSSANWGAPAVLSQIAFPRSGLCLRIHENRRRKSQNTKYSHPRTTGLAASAPGSPRSPGRGNRMF